MLATIATIGKRCVTVTEPQPALVRRRVMRVIMAQHGIVHVNDQTLNS